MMREALYGPVSEANWQKAEQIKLLICDVDGVFSDGRIYLGNQGEELKAFHTRDGFGVKALLGAGIQVAVITGRKSQIVENRMKALGIKHIYQGVDNKFEPYEELLKLYGVTPAQTAYIGDDMVDLPVMQAVGLSVCVADGHPWVRRHADLVTYQGGGFGALRELADLLLMAQDKFDSAHGMSV
ncbi:3-deoxy-manno-octulosonate-8-phosphatase KdsC [Shewanella cyperi]|uniref:3-deoxy-D-manno-octulosonate 8-phosphate phosphatase KdsC n=2 Tax=Shewanella cyperi TaxID=2814292 RepID=A0A974XR88_9GAMM|nr:3-deoxy-manno-octulosonate-8-phosphatase KdsC [Shewanella cyperi]QSX31948.1 3-deoxy-manno-octulosonate-8-phosphatase KdsC [Shewanella cyperi]QSX42712.1 3-deoxy-manno-octulosonate-8-phosphatase KdsC [Shewanella cyperi]